MAGKGTILYLGENGFPYGTAAVNRQKYIARGLAQSGFDVCVMCRKGIFDKDDIRVKNLDVTGDFEGVKYKYTSGSIYRPSGFFRRNALKVKGVFLEFFQLVTAIRKRQSIYMLVSSFSFYQVFYYFILAFCFRTKIILDVVEKNSALPERQNFRCKLNDLLYEHFLFRFMDGILFISDVLGNYISKKSAKTPSLKVPVVFDYDSFKVDVDKKEGKYFLFCGHALYLPTIEFILIAFDLLNNCNYHLKLILYGSKIYLNKCRVEVAKIRNKDKVIIYENLTDLQLFNYYKNAEALLVPLMDTPQDKARFPQKLSEYLATANPVLSTEIGEMKKHLKNNQTAFLSKEVKPNKFAELMEMVLKDPDNARRVGQNGRIIGEATFHYVKQGNRISDFLNTL